MLTKNHMLAILLVSLINPINFLLVEFFPPQGYVFNSDGLVLPFLMIMKSVEWDFSNPLDLVNRSSIFNPAMGSPTILIPLGYLAYFAGGHYKAVYLLAVFLASMLYFIVVSKLMSLFLDKKNHNTAFLIFVLGSGLGGLAQMFSRVLSSNFTGYVSPITYETGALGLTPLTHLRVFYHIASLIAGYLALYYLLKHDGKKKFWAVSVLHGIAILVYPLFGAVFLLLNLFHSILFKNIARFAKTSFIASVFALPWLYMFLRESFFFLSYSKATHEHMLLPLVVLTGFIPIILSSYFIVKETRISLWLVILSAVIFSTSQLYLIKAPLSAEMLLLQVPFYIVLFLASWKILKYPDKKAAFAMLSFVVILAMTVSEGDITVWFPSRIGYFLWLPVSILAAKGFAVVHEKYPVKFSHMLPVIIILFSLSVIAYSINYQVEQRSTTHRFYSVDETEALEFLKTQPPGNVISSLRSGDFIPYYTNKGSLINELVNLPAVEEYNLVGYERFFRNMTREEKKNVIKRFNITYVFYGKNERAIKSNSDFILQTPFVETIFEKNGIEVFRVMI